MTTISIYSITRVDNITFNIVYKVGRNKKLCKFNYIHPVMASLEGAIGYLVLNCINTRDPEVRVKFMHP